MSLDINTEKGQETLKDEIRTAEIFHHHFPSHRYIYTDKSSAAVADSIIIKDTKLIALVEAKGRDMSADQFDGEFNQRWLITAAKLKRNAAIARGLWASLYGFLYLRPNDLLIAKTLYDPRSGWLVDIEERISTTQATCNGGEATRLNAYVDMSGAKRYTIPKLDEPEIYRCETCGLVASFGYGVNIRAGRIGKWYCRLHRPVVAQQT